MHRPGRGPERRGRRGAGGYHSLALKADGIVVAWGDNDDGQCTVPAAAQSGVIAVAAGGNHSLALKADGRWWPGDTTITASATSRPRPERGDRRGAGGYHSLALKADGSVVAWGDNCYGQCTVPAAPTAASSPWPAGIATAWP